MDSIELYYSPYGLSTSVFKYCHTKPHHSKLDCVQHKYLVCRLFLLYEEAFRDNLYYEYWNEICFINKEVNGNVCLP